MVHGPGVGRECAASPCFLGGTDARRATFVDTFAASLAQTLRSQTFVLDMPLSTAPRPLLPGSLSARLQHVLLSDAGKNRQKGLLFCGINSALFRKFTRARYSTTTPRCTLHLCALCVGTADRFLLVGCGPKRRIQALGPENLVPRRTWVWTRCAAHAAWNRGYSRPESTIGTARNSKKNRAEATANRIAPSPL